MLNECDSRIIAVSMLHVYFGTDRQAVRDQAADFSEKNLPPDGTTTVIDAADYQPGQLADALGATSLFGGAEWFLVDTPSANPDLAEEVKTNLAAMAESSNTFIVLEGSLLAPAKKAYTKHTSTIEEFTAEKAGRFNTFALADALANKDRRQLWVLLQEAKLQGSAPEELIGIIWWQLKVLQLAATTRSATEAGMKEYSYSKAKRALSKFAPGELSRLSHGLLQLYHDGHAGVRDIDLALEQWVLRGT